MLTIEIFVWGKDRDRDHTALRAIPICPPHLYCVGRAGHIRVLVSLVCFSI